MRKSRIKRHLKQYFEFVQVDPYLRHQFLVLQPVLNNISQCTAFVTFSNAQLEWITVPCNLVFRHVIVVCQNETNITSLDDVNYQGLIRRQYWECEYGWVAIESRCSRMTSIKIPGHVRCHEALIFCNGSLPLVHYTNALSAAKLIRYYYYWLDYPREQAFYAGTLQNGNKTCTTMHLVERTKLAVIVASNSSEKCDAVACERPMRYSNGSCLRNQFQCGDGSCVLSHYVCDGIKDCPDDMDEEQCSHVCISNSNNTSLC